MNTIYIPSKGRADNCKTAEALKEDGIDFYVVVEPKDFDEYSKYYSNLLILDKEDQGITYVRNWIKDYSKSQGEKYHWQIDDNIRHFKQRVDGKNQKSSPFEVLSQVETYVSKHYNIGIAGIKHEMFAWSAKNPIDFNKQCYSCVYVNNSVKISWRKDMPEDTDYSLQLLKMGFVTVLFNRLIMTKATTMSMKGGNTEIAYGGDGRLQRAKNLIAQWPGIFTLRDKYGKTGIAPSRIWQSFKQRPLEHGSVDPQISLYD